MSLWLTMSVYLVILVMLTAWEMFRIRVVSNFSSINREDLEVQLCELVRLGNIVQWHGRDEDYIQLKRQSEIVKSNLYVIIKKAQRMKQEDCAKHLQVMFALVIEYTNLAASAANVKEETIWNRSVNVGNQLLDISRTLLSTTENKIRDSFAGPRFAMQAIRAIM